MADEPTSGAAPAATSVTPTAQAATITSPEPQAGEGNTEILSLDEARKLRKENQTLRARQKVLDDEKAASEAAKLSEVERMTKQYADVQAQNETLAAELLEA